jgi:hypothetical protein
VADLRRQVALLIAAQDRSASAPQADPVAANGDEKLAPASRRQRRS